MKKLLLCLWISVLAGCSTVAPPRSIGDSPSTAGQPAAPPYAAWDRVLQQFVDEQGRVDFAKLTQNRADLDQFVAYIWQFGPNNQPQAFPTRHHVLAWHINAYNALAMYQVLADGIPDSLSGFKKVRFFALSKVQVGGVPMSLYDYENKVIRPMGEPRVHMALNCMSISCPRLPRTAFSGEQLEAQLQAETERFVAEARNVTQDDASKTLQISEIFKLYTDDFLQQAASLPLWINRYRKTPVAESYRVQFIPYNWGINKQ
jgi:hypothetical protein